MNTLFERNMEYDIPDGWERALSRDPATAFFGELPYVKNVSPKDLDGMRQFMKNAQQRPYKGNLVFYKGMLNGRLAVLLKTSQGGRLYTNF